MAVLALSGCTGSEAGPGPLTSAEAPKVSAETGSLTGRVLDDEGNPLANAGVGVQGPMSQVTSTDAMGAYTINGLPPGTYGVIAQRLGYNAASLKAEIRAGETTWTNLTLKLMAVEGPRVEYFPYEGYVDGDVYTAALGLYYPRSFEVNLSRGAEEVVTTMRWDPSVPVFARYFWMQLSFSDQKMSASGKSPVRVNISDFTVEKAKEKATVAWRVAFACSGVVANPQGYATCVTGNPDSLVPQVAYQQRVKFFSSVFIHQRAPPGYTGLPA